MSELNTTRLRLARERRGLNQIELSALLGTAAGLAGQWERGSKEPSLKKLKQLAKALEVRIGWLLGEGEAEGEDEGDPLAVVQEQAHGYTRRRADKYNSRDAVLSDYKAPVGLRDLASDAVLVQALGITACEWTALGSFEFSDGLTKEGYCAVIMILRTCSVDARRRELDSKPGRHVATPANSASSVNL
ncbi:helix-turn-helix domain-containing protein [Candidatus Thiodictyon syntrophicum]|jgi:transcriptional regulator with XRE-family HTH domain|uniref:HTH cro/C1-type domain-containing protein n=1 Tax=Candidatus Thiodictyon syntrophicum TaxID=1166950 RepID=A0A2K8U8N7_9GAMM|nr:helix-turn-helix transcriptional regulator [Candidatus Thiodictyon syntrophicum]AUB81940.1 hypothetical protein THSYN_13885 [Candidatus Thiodictyon syntrophicum]